jgi:hypothetical protein
MAGMTTCVESRQVRYDVEGETLSLARVHKLLSEIKAPYENSRRQKSDIKFSTEHPKMLGSTV